MPTSAAHLARFQRASDQSLLVSFGDQITRQAHQDVHKLLRLLQRKPIAGVRNLHPAYCSLLIRFDPLRWLHADLEETLKSYLRRLEMTALPKPRSVAIPVCYGGVHGPDLQEASALLRMTPEELIRLHSSATYFVYFLGFVPGFAYLGELPAALAIPRLATPRKAVPAGSVGIAGNQTGIYPFATPGGWRLLGRTPVRLFRPERKELSLLSIGDRVRFTPISPAKFAALERA